MDGKFPAHAEVMSEVLGIHGINRTCWREVELLRHQHNLTRAGAHSFAQSRCCIARPDDPHRRGEELAVADKHDNSEPEYPATCR